MKIHADILQGSEDWFDLRLGRIGSTDASCLVVVGKSKSTLGTGAITMLYEKSAEIITGEHKNHYRSEAMDRGSELEPVARREYEDRELKKVKEAGYISKGDYFGYSPDGLIGDNGLVEIKCPEGPEFVRYSITNKISKAYYAQVQWALWISAREWCDFVVFNPDFPNNMIVNRITLDKDMQERFDKASEEFNKSLSKILERLRRQ